MKQSDKQIAVIGSGIAGLSAAWLLKDSYQVVLFEKNDYVGGHTHTIEVDDGAGTIAVDTGFIVYNEPNYPLLTRLLDHLGVESQDSVMSFAVSIGDGALEYAGDNLDTLFAQRRNLLNLRFLSMLKEILRFNSQCKGLLQDDGFGEMSLGEFLDRHGYRSAFRNQYLLPMAAAIWSCPTDTMLAFPAVSFARFFNNHGLLNLSGRPQWKTIVGGSWSYVKRMSADLQPSLHTNSPIHSISRQADGVLIKLTDGNVRQFDYVIMACHANEALTLLEDPSPSETELLSCFSYQSNEAWLHTDVGLMPHSRQVWSAWNYLATDNDSSADCAVSVTYWMNRLQRLQAEQNYLVSLNPLRPPQSDRVISRMTYQHPVFDRAAIQAQQRLETLQGQNRIWFCGSYFGYGFHEDALQSSVSVAQSLGVNTPWQQESKTEDALDELHQLANIARAAGS